MNADSARRLADALEARGIPFTHINAYGATLTVTLRYEDVDTAVKALEGDRCSCAYVHGDNSLCPVHNDLCPVCEGPKDRPWVRVRDGYQPVCRFTDEDVVSWHDIKTPRYEHYRCMDAFHGVGPHDGRLPLRTTREDVRRLREGLGWTRTTEAQERVPEARAHLASALGMYRHLHAQDGEDAQDGIETELARALDRLDRVIDGEDYIERSVALRERTNGAYHFTEPRPEVLPTHIPESVVERIAHDLDEALREHDRDPRTDVWHSLWDRLLDGKDLPERPGSVRAEEPGCDRYGDMMTPGYELYARWCGEPDPKRPVSDEAHYFHGMNPADKRAWETLARREARDE